MSEPALSASAKTTWSKDDWTEFASKDLSGYRGWYWDTTEHLERRAKLVERIALTAGLAATVLAAFPALWKIKPYFDPGIDWLVVFLSASATAAAASHRRLLDRARERERGRIAITQLYLDAELQLTMVPMTDAERVVYLRSAYKQIADIEGKHGGEMPASGNSPGSD